MPPLDLPELVLTRLEGTPRQQSWAEDLRRRAVRDLTEERANETARDALRRYRDKESAFDDKQRSDLEAAIKAVGGDEAAELILGREIFLDARGHVESFDRARDWIDLHVADKKTLLEAAEFHAAGTPQNAAAILRRYAADAKDREYQGDQNFTPRELLGKPKKSVDDKEDRAAAKRHFKELLPNADEAFDSIPGDVGKAVCEELARIPKEKRVGGIASVEVIGYKEIKAAEKAALEDPKNNDGPPLAAYNPTRRALRLRIDKTLEELHAAVKKDYKTGHSSTNSERHVLRHEIGHAVAKTQGSLSQAKRDAIREYWERLKKDVSLLSRKGVEDSGEMIAESFAVVLADAAGETVAPGKLKFAQDVVGALLHDEIAERLGDV